MSSNYKYKDQPLDEIAATYNTNITSRDVKNIMNDLSFTMSEKGYSDNISETGVDYNKDGTKEDIKFIARQTDFAGGLWGNDPVINVGDNNAYLDKDGNPIPFTSKESVIFNGLDISGGNYLLNIDRDSKYNNISIIGIKISYDEENKVIIFTLLGWDPSNQETTNLASTSRNDIKNNIIIEICGHGGNGGYGNSGASIMHYPYISEGSTIQGGCGGGGGGYFAALVNIHKLTSHLGIVRYHSGTTGWIDFGGNVALIYDGSNGSSSTPGGGGKVITNTSTKYHYNICSIDGAAGGDRSTNGTDISYDTRYSDKYTYKKSSYGGNKGDNKYGDIIYYSPETGPVYENGRLQYKFVYFGGGGGGGASLNSGGQGADISNKATTNHYGSGGGGGCGALDYRYHEDLGIIPVDSSVIRGADGGSWLIRVYAEKLDGSYDFSDIVWSEPTIPEI